MLKNTFVFMLLGVLAPSVAIAEAPLQPLVFAPGAVATLVKGRIKGQEDRRYTLAVGGGAGAACSLQAVEPGLLFQRLCASER